MASTFAEILADLVGQVPGALGAVFVDWEGEAVDQFSHIPAFDIQLAGAHWGIILKIVEDFLKKHRWGQSEVIILHSERSDVIIKPIDDEYTVVLATRAGTHLATALDALDRVTFELLLEM